MRIKTTYGQLKTGDRFFYDSLSPEGACRIKTTSGRLTHFANGNELYSPETWRDADEVWIDTEEKIEQQLTELANLRACIEDARSLLIDYDGYKTYKGLKKLIDQVDTLLMTHKPMEWLKAGE